MTAFFVCLNAVVPIFLIMALGCLARHLGAIKREDVPKFNRLLFRYFMPVMLFYNIYTSDLSGAVQPKLLIFAAGQGRAACLWALAARPCSFYPAVSIARWQAIW